MLVVEMLVKALVKMMVVVEMLVVKMLVVVKMVVAQRNGVGSSFDFV